MVFGALFLALECRHSLVLDHVEELHVFEWFSDFWFWMWFETVATWLHTNKKASPVLDRLWLEKIHGNSIHTVSAACQTSPTIPSQACHRDGRVGPPPHAEAQAGRHDLRLTRD